MDKLHVDGAEVLFVDENLVVLNKQPGISVIPGRGSDEHHCLQLNVAKATGSQVFIVHRIDKATSGIIIFARNSRAHRNLSMQFEHHTVQKEYLALVNGVVLHDGIINKPVKQFGSGRMGVHSSGKESVTEYVIAEKYSGATMLRVYPKTGRRHQIRVHLYDEGFPILGDELYGKDRPVGGVGRLMLHAASISLEYPEKKELTLSAEPDGMWNAIVNKYIKSA